MLSIELVNNDADAEATLHSITLTHRGAGRTADIDRVYATFGDERLTDEVSINAADRRVTLRFVPSLHIAAMQSVSLTIFADMSPSAASASEHMLILMDPADVDAEGKYVALMSTGANDSRARTAGPSRGTISVEYLDVSGPVRYGKRRTIARIRLSADAVEDHRLYSIILTNDGKARRADLQSLFVQSNRGSILTQTMPKLAGAHGDTVKFLFTPPYPLGKNASVVLNVIADVSASRRKTIRLIVDEPSDISAVPDGTR
jgi:hypothetical protein